MERTKQSKKISKKQIKWIIISVLLILGLVAMNLYDNYLLKNDYKYTIGEIYEIRGTRSGYIPHLKYYIKNKEYDAGFRIREPDKSYIGRRFIIKFYPPNPDNCDIFLNMPVPDSIKEAPIMGWDSIEFKNLFGGER